MSRPIVVIAEAIADAGIERLSSSHEVVDAVGMSRDELMGLMGDAAAIIVRSATQVDREMIEAAPGLKVVARAGIGVDNIDLVAATERGVLVVNAPNANTISAAEHTMALLLAQARRIPEADRSLREGRWDRREFSGIELHGKTLGVLGLGRIGTLVAQRALSFGMRIVAYDPYVSTERAKRLGVEMLTLDEVFAEAHMLTIHVPLTPETENLINAASIAKMRDGVRIVNVARGGIVSEEDLAEAVRSGKVGGAGVDVFDTEPTTESPLFDIPQITVTPHLGASTLEAQDKAGISVAKAVSDALAGEFVLSAVNLDMGTTVSPEARPFIKLSEQLGTIFAVFSKGLPDTLTVCTQGQLADEPVRPLALAVLKGALSTISDVPVSYVNAPLVAEEHGVSVIEECQQEVSDYQSVIRISGVVAGRHRTVVGTYMERRGAVLLGVDGYAFEVPLTDHMLLVRNEDLPGSIGRVGTYLGDVGSNISDMVVGRAPDGTAAMMGIALDEPMTQEQAAGLLDLDGIAAARYIDLA
ncbi:MAG: phosphoglycerate dehydrogenase [Actinobacteria bacterium]|nr:MAG: phosphoglycerate dehydrogenase [Actinomycetota bacterium]